LAILEILIRELCGLPQMLWVVGGGDVVSENASLGMREPDFTDGYATVRSDAWHFHISMESVTGIQFVEAEDHGIPFLYYVRFSNEKEETLVRCYFPNPYLDDYDNTAEFQPEKLELFEELRDRYVGQEGIIFAKRPSSPSR